MNFIRQGDLERLDQLNRQKKQLEREQQALRARLIGAHYSGAIVEPGALDLQVREIEARQFSRAALEHILGPEMVEQLRARLIPRVTTNLRVVRAKGVNSHV